jgi:Second Messenger Oligonucleotide or Dinucleotide Synthetase domain
MGGGGGSIFYGRPTPERLIQAVREAENKADDQQFTSKVCGLLGDALAQYNSRDIEGIQSILDKVKNDLGEEFEGTVDLVFGGSVVKHTYVDGLSDVDALVILKETHIDGDSPEGLIAQFAEKLQARFGRGEGIVKQGRLAVTLRIDGKEIQLLPAMRIGDGFKIASSDGRGWAKINPKNFSEKLTKANQSLDGKLIPTIKLAKSIIANLPEQRQLSGYHTESLAINVFKGYGGPKNVKDMLKHFFNSAAEYCKKPIKDSTGQSVHVDEYLGEDNSLPRLAIADALGRIGRRLANADGAHSLEQWRDVLNID